MEFQWKKVENCFADAKTFAYRLPIAGAAFLRHIPSFSVAVNDKFRRPLFVAENDEGMRIKGILKEKIIKVSFPDKDWERRKADFEAWLETLQEDDRDE